MRLLINHQTSYRYDFAVNRSLQYLRLIPQTLGHQQVINWQLAASGHLLHQQDGFGNIWSALSIDEPHHHLLVMAQGEVELQTAEDGVRDQRHAPELFLLPTELTRMDGALLEFGQRYLRRRDRYGLIDLAQAVLDHMPYTTGSTHVMTSAADAFAQGQGVCQDHTHVFLACARQAKLPARYVSGYLYTHQETHLASHAWAEVYLDGLWYCFDVSNQLFTPSQHVQLAVGRDYLDAAPVRGVRQGGGGESMHALVQVLPSPKVKVV